MAASASSLTIRLFGEDVSASRTLDRVGAQAEVTSSKFGKLGAVAGTALAGIAAAAGVVGAASVKLAMDFDQQMTRLSTQAHVPQAQIKQLSNSVLDLAGKVGVGPTSLAEGLYHVESAFASTGITGAKAMDILKAAAEGARIGGSDLVDTTNALDAAVVSGIKGVQNYQQAMGALNATVGAGDMTMQDLAEAMGTGVLAVVKNFGVTLADASAALATFGDNNIRGAYAGTQLRMVVQSLAVQAAPAQKVLEGIGISVGQLARDMQTGGLTKALADLVQHLNNAGITGAKVGEFLTEAFTKKSSAGLGILVGQFDRFNSKFGEAQKGANQFANDWAQQQKQFSQQLKDLEAGLEAVGVRIGNFLIPKIMAVGSAIGSVWHEWEPKFKAAGESLGKQFMQGFNGQVNAPQHFMTPGLQKQSDPRFASGGTSGAPSLFQQLGEDARKVVPYLQGFWKTLQQVGTELYQHLVPYFKDWGRMLSQDVWPAVKNLWAALQDWAPLFKLLAEIAGGVLIVTLRAFGLVLKDVIGPGILLISFLVRGLSDYLTGTFAKAMMSTASFWKGLWNGMKGVVVPVVQTILNVFMDMVGGIIHGAAAAFGWVPKIGGDLKKARAAFDEFKAGVTHDLDQLAGTHVVNVNVRTSVGDAAAAMSLPNKASQYATGGLVTGPGGPRDDMVPAWLSNGEAVVPAHLVPAIAPFLGAHGVPGFADGGLVVQTNAATAANGLGAQLKQIVDAALQKFASVFNFSGIIGGGVSQWSGLVSQVLSMLGLAPSLVGKVLAQMTTESGGNPNAVNLTDSNAAAGHPSMGLMQVIGPTFAAYAGPYAALGITNPLANIYAGLNYAMHRYGPGLSGLGQGHGYALGGFASGWAKVGEAGPEMVYLGRGGQVVSNRDSGAPGGRTEIHLHGPVYADSAGIKRLMSDIDREVARGGSVPATFRR